MGLKKVCLVTGARSEYGILRKLIKKLESDKEIRLDLIVTGMHLEGKYGNTINDIKADNIIIHKEINLNLKDSTNKTIVKGISTLMSKLSVEFSENHYDLVIILGDRFEMLAVSNTATIFGVPICHIHGGEKTLGNYDEYIRHSITKMSQLHLVSTEEYRNRVIQMGEIPEKVFNIGAMGNDGLDIRELMSVKELESKLAIELEKDYWLVLFHPVTLDGNQSAESQVNELIFALKKSNKQCLFIGSNADSGSDIIMEKFTEYVNDDNKSHLFRSLPSSVYHSLVHHAKALVGNSSSGLIEVPSLMTPTLNVGERQLGRIYGPSVINSECERKKITEAFEQVEQVTNFYNPYHQENSVCLAYEIIKKEIQSITNKKNFNDLKVF